MVISAVPPCEDFEIELTSNLISQSPTMQKLRSKATRTLVSMLVRFFLRRPDRPSMPSMGEEREEGLGSMLSTAMISVGEGYT